MKFMLNRCLICRRDDTNGRKHRQQSENADKKKTEPREPDRQCGNYPLKVGINGLDFSSMVDNVLIY